MKDPYDAMKILCAATKTQHSQINKLNFFKKYILQKGRSSGKVKAGVRGIKIFLRKGQSNMKSSGEWKHFNQSRNQSLE